jgi:hypothetical protein
MGRWTRGEAEAGDRPATGGAAPRAAPALPKKIPQGAPGGVRRVRNGPRRYPAKEARDSPYFGVLGDGRQAFLRAGPVEGGSAARWLNTHLLPIARCRSGWCCGPGRARSASAAFRVTRREPRRQRGVPGRMAQAPLATQNGPGRTAPTGSPVPTASSTEVAKTRSAGSAWGPRGLCHRKASADFLASLWFLWWVHEDSNLGPAD